MVLLVLLLVATAAHVCGFLVIMSAGPSGKSVTFTSLTCLVLGALVVMVMFGNGGGAFNSFGTLQNNIMALVIGAGFVLASITTAIHGMVLINQ